MRILINGINHHPEPTGIGKYTGEMAEWLAAMGHRVRVVTAHPYYPAWKVAEGYRWWSYGSERIAGVEIVRCPVWVPRRPSGLTRLVHLQSFALSTLPVMLSHAAWRPDVVIAVEPTFFSVPGALMAGRLSGARTWLHIQDLELDAAFDLGLLPRGGGVERGARAVERWIMRRFDSVSSISARMVEQLRDKGIDADRAILFPNWVDTRQIRPLDYESPLREELGFSAGDLAVLCAGNMGEKQGLEVLVEAAARVAHDQSVRFVLCGDGVAKHRLENQTRGLGLRNVTFIPVQPAGRLNELLNLADIHALLQKAEVSDDVMPSRLTGMLASGRPVVATAAAGTELARLVVDMKVGLLAPPGDAAGLADAIMKLAASAKLRGSLGGRARRYAVENMDKELVLRRALSSLCEAKSESVVEVRAA